MYVNGGDIHGILIPVKDGESVKVIPYVVTSEDGDILQTMH